MFNAIYLEKSESAVTARVAALDDAALMEGDVTVRIDYSTVNYKDGLALSNKSPVVRKWPMVPGIDFAGTVETSAHPLFKSGDAVILNGWGVGESHWGGLAQRARVKGDWLIARPPGLSAQRAMAIGTAGYTAMLCALALTSRGVTKESGEILVTGAAGGVGSVAIAILSGWGYRVVASTRRVSEGDYLRGLGATEIIDAATMAVAGKPLAKERWAGVIDSVGSHTLANACAATKYGGVVAACGLAQGMDFPASVAPFILRALQLIGIDSVMAPRAVREAAWSKLATDLDMTKLDALTTMIGLTDAIAAGTDIVAGKIRGRLVVDVNA